MLSARFWRKVIPTLGGCIFATFCILSSFREDKSKFSENWHTYTNASNFLPDDHVRDNPSAQVKEEFNGELNTEITASQTATRSKDPHICHKTVVRKRSFPNIRHCSNYTTRLCDEGTFNLTALVSYPGSGNTWLRHLIEISTGFFTGSVYFDHDLHARGFLGEREDWDSGSTIVQKLHVKYNPLQNFQRGILIIRDPILATRSFVDYLESGHTGWASPTTFNKKEWPLYLLHSTHDWLALAKSWIESPIELLVIHYENLIKSTSHEVRKVLKFLHMKESRLDSECFMKSIEGSFHRRHPNWKKSSPPPSKVRHLIDDGIDYLNQLLKERDKEPIPLDKYSCYRNTGDKCRGKDK